MFGNVSSVNKRVQALESEVNRLEEMVKAREAERLAVIKEKELLSRLDDLRKDLGLV